MNIGSGDNGELTFLDAVAVVSFLVGLQNLEINITQEDMQNTEHRLYKALKGEIEDVHRHLELQDAKIDKLLKRGEEK